MICRNDPRIFVPGIHKEIIAYWNSWTGAIPSIPTVPRARPSYSVMFKVFGQFEVRKQFLLHTMRKNSFCPEVKGDVAVAELKRLSQYKKSRRRSKEASSSYKRLSFIFWPLWNCPLLLSNWTKMISRRLDLDFKVQSIIILRHNQRQRSDRFVQLKNLN
jgi:hypothetical protein